MTLISSPAYLIVTGALISACAPKLTHDVIRNEEGSIVVSSYINKQGLRDGPFVMYFDSGELDYACTYVRDSIDGLFTSYFQNGQLKCKFEYRMNRLWNILEVHDPNGNNLDHGNISNGEGLYIGYYKDKKRWSGMCHNGLKVGYWHLFSNAPGITDSVLYIDGRRQDTGRFECFW